MEFNSMFLDCNDLERTGAEALSLFSSNNHFFIWAHWGSLQDMKTIN